MSIMTGRCSCEAVRYEVAGEPLFTHACHCTMCQRRSGGAFGLSMLIEPEQLRITQGELTPFEIRADSGNLKVNYFCARCGTMIYNMAPARPGIVVLRPGTLDDTSRVRPQAHIWMKSRQPWVNPGDGAPCFDLMYDREQVWPQASLQRLRQRSQAD